MSAPAHCRGHIDINIAPNRDLTAFIVTFFSADRAVLDGQPARRHEGGSDVADAEGRRQARRGHQSALHAAIGSNGGEAKITFNQYCTRLSKTFLEEKISTAEFTSDKFNGHSGILEERPMPSKGTLTQLSFVNMSD